MLDIHIHYSWSKHTELNLVQNVHNYPFKEAVKRRELPRNWINRMRNDCAIGNSFHCYICWASGAQQQAGSDGIYKQIWELLRRLLVHGRKALTNQTQAQLCNSVCPSGGQLVHNNEMGRQKILLILLQNQMPGNNSSWLWCEGGRRWSVCAATEAGIARKVREE